MTETLPILDARKPATRTTNLPESLRQRYRVRRILGTGGFGVVLLAKDTLIGRLVAVKMLYRQFEDDTQIAQRLLQEARIAGQVAHPNIVSIYTVEQAEGFCCIIMEYLGGGNLGELLRAAKTALPPPTVVNIILGVLEGLKVAHTLRVVHRDLKPENILFDNAGVPKISDFGLARLPDEVGNLEDQGAKVFGTPLYMAPEQFARDADVDERTDLYSVGVMLYEALLGQRLHLLPGVKDITDPKTLPPASEIIAAVGWPDAVPDPLRALVARLVARDVAARVGTASELIRLLRPLAARQTTNLAGLGGVLHSGGGYTLSNIDILRDTIELLLTDGFLSLDERVELNRRAERLGIDEHVAVRIEEEVRAKFGLPTLAALHKYRRLLDSVLRLGEITAQDRQILDARATELGIGEDERRSIEESCRPRRRARRTNSAPGRGRAASVAQLDVVP
jgi:serine/threonine protein kinase